MRQPAERRILMKLCKKQNEIETEYILPVRVVVSENADNPEILLEEHIRQPFLENASYASLACTIKKGGYAVFDFGEEFQGGADFVVQSTVRSDEHSYPHMRIVFGESVSESLSTIGVKNATNDHSPRDIIVETPFLSHHTLGNTGYRFLKLEALDADISISSLQGVSRFRRLEYIGSFNCSDERLNRIWQTGARTVHLNMQEYLWDGIKRDRLVWVGDMHPETSSVSMIFGETDVVKKSLDFIRDNTPPSAWINNIPSYSMWWIKIHRDLYRDFGNTEYLHQQCNYTISTLKKVLSCLDGESSDMDYHFTEWSSAGTDDEDAGFYAMLVIGLEAGAEILDILKQEPSLAEKCRSAADSLKTKSFPDVKNKQTAAMLGLSGIHSISDICESIIKPGGAHGLSAFWGYYVLNALAENNDISSALDIIRTYWGAMLDLGATTFWEDFDMEWAKNAAPIDEVCPPDKNDIHADFGKFCYTQFRHSLCHGWSSGPTAFLSRRVLGIIPTEPGYKKIKVHPMLGDLDFAEGAIPTPFGAIEVKHTKTDGKIKTELSLPKEVEIESCETVVSQLSRKS